LKRNFGRKKKGSVDGNDSTSLLSDHIMNSSSSSSALMSLDQLENCAPPSNFSYNNSNHMNSLEGMGLSTEQVLRIHAETQLMRQQFELLKRATADHLEQLPENVRVWGQQISQSLQSSQAEVARLQMKLAMECASRRKLLNEVQDLRGAVRVYCRPKPSNQDDEYMELPSHDSILFHRDKYDDEHGPVSFEFDRVFDPNNAKQQDVYAEVQDVCLGVLDGYNICIMAYGPNQCGKTTTIFGNIDIVNRDSIQIQNYGIHLQAMHQLFTIAEHRSERYKDVFSLTIIEVHNERIRDLIAATETGSRCGHVMIAETKNGMTGNINVNRKQKTSVDNDDASSGRPSKLEIRTDIHGDTVIQGLVTVEVNSMAEVLSLWQECIAVKVRRLEEQGVDISKYDAANHVIATLRVKSHNIATGVGTIGKIQFVDFAAADIIPRNQSVPDGSTDDTTAITVTGTTTYMNQNEWKFANRSLETFCECIEARMQFDRNVPYRNSTLTHLLRDSLESDTKVILFACISSDPTHMNETTAVLKFASQLRRVIIGKATKHILSSS
jgi:kinesin family protein C2/C3